MEDTFRWQLWIFFISSFFWKPFPSVPGFWRFAFFPGKWWYVPLGMEPCQAATERASWSRSLATWLWGIPRMRRWVVHASTRNIRRSDGRNVANEVWGKGGDFQLGEWQWCGFFCVVGIDFFGGIGLFTHIPNIFCQVANPKKSEMPSCWVGCWSWVRDPGSWVCWKGAKIEAGEAGEDGDEDEGLLDSSYSVCTS